MKRRFMLPVVSGFIAMFLLVAVTSFAQDKKHNPEKRAKMMTEKMKSSIALTDEQYTKVYDLNLSYANKMLDLKKQELSKEEKQKSFKSMRQEKHAALTAILSKEQMEKYKAMLKEQRKEMHDKRREHKQKEA